MDSLIINTIPKNVKDITGRKFGRMTAVAFSHIIDKPSNHSRYWWFRCDCGKYALTRHKETMQSCGCLRKENARVMGKSTATHGMTNTRLFRTWTNMRTRCYNPNEPAFKYYGARGITICADWLNNFEAFRDWAFSSGYADDLQIDRRDNILGYFPDNCRWVTWIEQQNNKRDNHCVTHNGERLSMADAARRLGVDRSIIKRDVGKGRHDFSPPLAAK